jgi:hypothetical protein
MEINYSLISFFINYESRYSGKDFNNETIFIKMLVNFSFYFLTFGYRMHFFSFEFERSLSDNSKFVIHVRFLFLFLYYFSNYKGNINKLLFEYKKNKYKSIRW